MQNWSDLRLYEDTTIIIKVLSGCPNLFDKGGNIEKTEKLVVKKETNGGGKEGGFDGENNQLKIDNTNNDNDNNNNHIDNFDIDNDIDNNPETKINDNENNNKNNDSNNKDTEIKSNTYQKSPNNFFNLINIINNKSTNKCIGENNIEIKDILLAPIKYLGPGVGDILGSIEVEKYYHIFHFFYFFSQFFFRFFTVFILLYFS